MDQAIALPDLESQVDLEISRENIYAAQAIYFAYLLDEMRLFAVIDRIVDLFQQGLLPLGRGGARPALEQQSRRPRQQAEAVRRNAYWRIFGLAHGEAAHGEHNTDFRALWTHFMVAAAECAGAGGSSPQPAATPQLREAARVLALNLSTHVGPGARAVAERLTADIRQTMEIVGDHDVQQAFGARSAWQVIDRINASHLGTPVEVGRLRTQANAAWRIFERLAHLDDETPADDLELLAAVDEWMAANAQA